MSAGVLRADQHPSLLEIRVRGFLLGALEYARGALEHRPDQLREALVLVHQQRRRRISPQVHDLLPAPR
jgi:hypothetical protein